MEADDVSPAVPVGVVDGQEWVSCLRCGVGIMIVDEFDAVERHNQWHEQIERLIGGEV